MNKVAVLPVAVDFEGAKVVRDGFVSQLVRTCTLGSKIPGNGSTSTRNQAFFTSLLTFTKSPTFKVNTRLGMILAFLDNFLTSLHTNFKNQPLFHSDFFVFFFSRLELKTFLQARTLTLCVQCMQCVHSKSLRKESYKDDWSKG